jgi:RimJ/RimL family protein N-acetyltransferase
MMDVIYTKRLVLRVPTPEDAGALAQAINHHDVVRYILCPYPYDIAHADGFIASNLNNAIPAYSIFKDAELIGGIGLDDELELGYWITPSEWGQGYVTEASNVLLARHFAKPDAADVNSGYQPSNLGSAAVQVKLGFRIISHTTEIDKVWGEYNHDNTVLTRKDWLATQGLPIVAGDLTLRPVTMVDALDIQRIAGNDDTAPMMGVMKSPWPLDDVRDWIERRMLRMDGRWNLVIERDNQPIGFVGVGGNFDNSSSKYDLWLYYFIDKSHWGQGIATTAATALLAHVFANTDLDYVNSDSFTDNPASMATLARLGFEKVGNDVGKSAARLEPAPLFVYRLTRTKFESLS